MRVSAAVVLLAVIVGLMLVACSGKPSESELFDQAQLLAQEKQFKQAAATYEKILELYPNSEKAANIQFTLGSTYAMFDTALARVAYSTFIEKYGDTVDPYMLESAKFELNNLGRDLDEVIDFQVLGNEESAAAK